MGPDGITKLLSCCADKSIRMSPSKLVPVKTSWFSTNVSVNLKFEFVGIVSTKIKFKSLSNN